MIERQIGRVERLRHALDDGPGGNDLGLRRLNHAAQKRVVRGCLDAAVHQARLLEFHLVLQAQAAAAVHQPECAAGGCHGGHRPVQKLHVKLRWLDIRFRQIGDLGHQLADLVLCLLEQTSVNGFFRHGGTRG